MQIIFERPITLVGYSIGSRLIFSCMKELNRLSKLNRNKILKTSDIDNDATDTKEDIDSEGDELDVESIDASVYSDMVQDVVLLGAPISTDSKNWKEIRSIISGRLINGYSTNDLVLGIVYRYERFKYNVSGVQPVDNEKLWGTVLSSSSSLSSLGVENIDLSNIIYKHTDYTVKMKEILQSINLTGTHNYSL